MSEEPKVYDPHCLHAECCPKTFWDHPVSSLIGFLLLHSLLCLFVPGIPSAAFGWKLGYTGCWLMALYWMVPLALLIVLGEMYNKREHTRLYGN